MGNNMIQSYEELFHFRKQMQKMDTHYWVQQNLFTWQWWLLVGLTVIPLIIWWRIVDRKRAYEIAFYGCMINLFAVILDDIGTGLLWWGYPIRLEPLAPPLLTADSILVPIILMQVYQRYASTWRSFFIANTIAGAIIAFIFEPIFIWIGYYQLIKWKLVYSFLFYLIVSTTARFIIVKLGKGREAE